jgi:hypothetical protein
MGDGTDFEDLEVRAAEGALEEFDDHGLLGRCCSANRGSLVPITGGDERSRDRCE